MCYPSRIAANYVLVNNPARPVPRRTDFLAKFAENSDFFARDAPRTIRSLGTASRRAAIIATLPILTARSTAGTVIVTRPISITWAIAIAWTAPRTAAEAWRRGTDELILGQLAVFVFVERQQL